MVFWRDTGTYEDEEDVDALDMGGMTAAAITDSYSGVATTRFLGGWTYSVDAWAPEAVASAG